MKLRGLGMSDVRSRQQIADFLNGLSLSLENNTERLVQA